MLDILEPYQVKIWVFSYVVVRFHNISGKIDPLFAIVTKKVLLCNQILISCNLLPLPISLELVSSDNSLCLLFSYHLLGNYITWQNLPLFFFS